jgi:hypothetical protein
MNQSFSQLFSNFQINSLLKFCLLAEDNPLLGKELLKRVQTQILAKDTGHPRPG